MRRGEECGREAAVMSQKCVCLCDMYVLYMYSVCVVTAAGVYLIWAGRLPFSLFLSWTPCITIVDSIRHPLTRPLYIISYHNKKRQNKTEGSTCRVWLYSLLTCLRRLFRLRPQSSSHYVRLDRNGLSGSVAPPSSVCVPPHPYHPLSSTHNAPF